MTQSQEPVQSESMTKRSARGTSKRRRTSMSTKAHDGTMTLSGITTRVSRLETSMEVLGNQVKSLSEDISLSDKKQDNFFNEWRTQKEQERKEKEQMFQARQTTPRDLIMMLAASVTMCAALAGFGNYIMQTNIARATEPIVSSLSNVPSAINAAVTPLTERQNAASQSSLNQRDAIDRLSTSMSDVRGTLSELQRVSQDNSRAIGELERGRIESVQHRAQIAEQIKGEAQSRKDADDSIKGELNFFREKLDNQR